MTRSNDVSTPAESNKNAMRRNTTLEGNWRAARATDPIADVALVGLVVRHELGGALDVAVVHLVVEEAVDSHHH
jgi:hypothetical protein